MFHTNTQSRQKIFQKTFITRSVSVQTLTNTRTNRGRMENGCLLNHELVSAFPADKPSNSLQSSYTFLVTHPLEMQCTFTVK